MESDKDNISKTVRFPADLYEFIDRQEGNDFTKKLIKVLRFAQEGDELHRITLDSFKDAVAKQKSLLLRLSDLESTVIVLDQLTLLVKDLVKELQEE